MDKDFNIQHEWSVKIIRKTLVYERFLEGLVEDFCLKKNSHLNFILSR